MNEQEREQNAHTEKYTHKINKNSNMTTEELQNQLRYNNVNENNICACAYMK